MDDQSRYVEICRALIAAIRSASPDRLIFANGADIGQTPVTALIDEGIVQSSHDYQPKMVSHYKAFWVPAREFESRDADLAHGRQEQQYVGAQHRIPGR